MAVSGTSCIRFNSNQCWSRREGKVNHEGIIIKTDSRSLAEAEENEKKGTQKYMEKPISMTSVQWMRQKSSSSSYSLPVS